MRRNVPHSDGRLRPGGGGVRQAIRPMAGESREEINCGTVTGNCGTVTGIERGKEMPGRGFRDGLTGKTSFRLS
jgi:hypothetical protein